jgi:hypothetical protein
LYLAATGKAPWPEFTNNMAALFHVATTKVPPPMPVNASPACVEFLSRYVVLSTFVGVPTSWFYVVKCINSTYTLYFVILIGLDIIGVW